MCHRFEARCHTGEIEGNLSRRLVTSAEPNGSIGPGPYTRGSREGSAAIAVGADGLVDDTLCVEAAGAALHMGTGGDILLSEVTAIQLTCRIPFQHKEIKIGCIRIRIRLDGAGGGGHAGYP